jgi:hypothetical protein
MVPVNSCIKMIIFQELWSDRYRGADPQDSLSQNCGQHADKGGVRPLI